MIAMRCWIGLNALNFFIAAVQTGFGPFFSVYLTEQGWSQVDIGVALSIGTASALAFQLPAGALVDHIQHKRFANALGLLLIGVSALMLVAEPTPAVGAGARRSLHAFGSCMLGAGDRRPHAALCPATMRSASGSASMPATPPSATRLPPRCSARVAYYLSKRAVFLVTALLCLPALRRCRCSATATVSPDDHPATAASARTQASEQHPWHIFDEPTLHIFAVCAVLFHVRQRGHAAARAQRTVKAHRRDRLRRLGGDHRAAGCRGAVLALGRAAWRRVIGRKPILLVGFAALPMRGLLFATLPDAVPLVAMQMLDGVSATVFGLMVPLIAADVTRRTGYLNLAISSLGLAAGLGATVSTTAAGWLADMVGAPVAFLGLALVGLAALAVVWRLMPETQARQAAHREAGRRRRLSRLLRSGRVWA